jgi:adenylate cyclase
MSYDLFEREEGILKEARALVDNDGFVRVKDRKAYTELLKGYEKLFKSTRRLVRFSDRNEAELNRMAEKQRQAAEEITRKNKELETLSLKLAKYLSPQVYNSIFEGRQEVKLASGRKKLTVFFSDIADFTETTEKMESEDLTQLLNQYLTEMSAVALKYGATIDKFIGDAIMIFFGDPETRGVKEDALACVEMAIAMQKRIGELADVWRDAGIEQPLRCRIGIHTGYCTVGNFGSNDRMDYTIIGGGVNLASRLEHEAPAGGILVSYETFALVKDEILCEEQGHVRVKGIAYPVATYRAVDLRSNLGPGEGPIHTELPHFRLDADPGRMPPEARALAATALRAALARLNGTAAEAD